MDNRKVKLTLALLIVVSVLIVLVWPRKNKEIAVDSNQRLPFDSLSLKVAVLPTYGCLPFYWAVEQGIYDSLGVDVQLITYQAQLDCDTALQANHVECIYTDLIRAARLQSMGVGLRVCVQIDERMQLITQRKQRIRETKQLKEKTIALARLSITDYLTDLVVNNTEVSTADVYRPQINDVRLRAEMLCNEQVDAIISAEPYATMAVVRGHRSVMELPHDLTCMAISYRALQDSTRVEQTKLLIQGYNIAVDRLNTMQSLRQLNYRVLGYFNLPNEVIDSISLPQFKHTKTSKRVDVEASVKFLLEREAEREPKQIPMSYTGDTLLTTKFLSNNE